MFLLDSLMISGLRWTLETILTAADAERNDDHALREQLLEAEVRREAGEISGDEFARLERDLLARIREIRERREGGSGPLAFSTRAEGDAPAPTLTVDASVGGEFHTNEAGAEAPAPAGVSAAPASRRAGGSARTARRRRTGAPAAGRTRTARVR